MKIIFKDTFNKHIDTLKTPMVSVGNVVVMLCKVVIL